MLLSAVSLTPSIGLTKHVCSFHWFLHSSNILLLGMEEIKMSKAQFLTLRNLPCWRIQKYISHRLPQLKMFTNVEEQQRSNNCLGTAEAQEDVGYIFDRLVLKAFSYLVIVRESYTCLTKLLSCEKIHLKMHCKICVNNKFRA